MRRAARPQPALASHLSEAQIAALALAEGQGWGVAVEAAGEVVTLRQGRPQRRLILLLGPAAWAADDELAAAERHAA